MMVEVNQMGLARSILERFIKSPLIKLSQNSTEVLQSKLSKYSSTSKKSLIGKGIRGLDSDGGPLYRSPGSFKRVGSLRDQLKSEVAKLNNDPIKSSNPDFKFIVTDSRKGDSKILDSLSSVSDSVLDSFAVINSKLDDIASELYNGFNTTQQLILEGAGANGGSQGQLSANGESNESILNRAFSGVGGILSETIIGAMVKGTWKGIVDYLGLSMPAIAGPLIIGTLAAAAAGIAIYKTVKASNKDIEWKNNMAFGAEQAAGINDGINPYLTSGANDEANEVTNSVVKSVDKKFNTDTVWEKSFDEGTGSLSDLEKYYPGFQGFSTDYISYIQSHFNPPEYQSLISVLPIVPPISEGKINLLSFQSISLHSGLAAPLQDLDRFSDLLYTDVKHGWWIFSKSKRIYNIKYGEVPMKIERLFDVVKKTDDNGSFIFNYDSVKDIKESKLIKWMINQVKQIMTGKSTAIAVTLRDVSFKSIADKDRISSDDAIRMEDENYDRVKSNMESFNIEEYKNELENKVKKQNEITDRISNGNTSPGLYSELEALKKEEYHMRNFINVYTKFNELIEFADPIMKELKSADWESAEGLKRAYDILFKFQKAINEYTHSNTILDDEVKWCIINTEVPKIKDIKGFWEKTKYWLGYVLGGGWKESQDKKAQQKADSEALQKLFNEIGMDQDAEFCTNWNSLECYLIVGFYKRFIAGALVHFSSLHKDSPYYKYFRFAGAALSQPLFLARRVTLNKKGVITATSVSEALDQGKGMEEIINDSDIISEVKVYLNNTDYLLGGKDIGEVTNQGFYGINFVAWSSWVLYRMIIDILTYKSEDATNSKYENSLTPTEGRIIHILLESEVYLNRCLDESERDNVLLKIFYALMDTSKGKVTDIKEVTDKISLDALFKSHYEDSTLRDTVSSDVSIEELANADTNNNNVYTDEYGVTRYKESGLPITSEELDKLEELNKEGKKVPHRRPYIDRDGQSGAGDIIDSLSGGVAPTTFESIDNLIEWLAIKDLKDTEGLVLTLDQYKDLIVMLESSQNKVLKSLKVIESKNSSDRSGDIKDNICTSNTLYITVNDGGV